MITVLYDHHSGLSVVPKQQFNSIRFVLKEINPRVGKNTITEIRGDIVNGLLQQGWSGEYRLDVTSKITISSFQNNIGLCLQTGNVGRIYADLIKLQSLYLTERIKAGVIIIPQKELAVKLTSNVANYERLIGELPIFSQVISMPILIFGFNVEE